MFNSELKRKITKFFDTWKDISNKKRYATHRAAGFSSGEETKHLPPHNKRPSP